MPELPEVQTIVDDLNNKVKGFTIVDFWSDVPKSIKMDLAKFKREIIGKKIEKAQRRGKNILIYLSGGKLIHVHLKMTGHLLVKQKGKENVHLKEKINQYIHHIWYLTKNKIKIELEFSDMRMFAKIRVIDTDKMAEDPDLGNLGTEPLSREFTTGNLEDILAKKKKSMIRDILMDQCLIVGIGNIYVSEILFEAGILPTRRAADISKEETKKLHKAIKNILIKGVKLRGTSISDYRDTEGAQGGFQKILKVYNRGGMECRRNGCEGIVKREKAKQRSSFFCEQCQK